MPRPLAFALPLVAISCVAETAVEPTRATCPIEGTYQVVETRDEAAPGSCPTDADDGAPLALTLTRQGSGVVLSWPAVPGGCPGRLTGCEVTAQCELRDKTSATVARSDWTLRLTETGLEGYEASAFYPPATKTRCTGNYRLSGERR